MDIVTKEADNGLIAIKNASQKLQNILTHTEEVTPFIKQTIQSVKNIVGDFKTFATELNDVVKRFTL